MFTTYLHLEHVFSTILNLCMLISFWPPGAWLLRPLRNWHMEAYHYCLASCWCDAGRDFQMVRCFRVSTNQFICEPKRPVELRNYKHYYAVYIKPLQHGLLISPLEKPETTSTSAASHSPFNPLHPKLEEGNIQEQHTYHRIHVWYTVYLPTFTIKRSTKCR